MAKLNRKVKISLWIAGSLVALLAFCVLLIFVAAKRSVDTFRADASNQLNSAIAGKKTDATIELSSIPFGDLVNKDYKNIKNLQETYRKLLADVKNYISIRDAHDALVSQYNDGVKGEKPLSGDLLKSVNRYLKIAQNSFANEKDRIDSLKTLSEKIISNTDFDSIRGDIDSLLSNDGKWLNDLRDQLNKNIKEFQNKVN